MRKLITVLVIVSIVLSASFVLADTPAIPECTCTGHFLVINQYVNAGHVDKFVTNICPVLRDGTWYLGASVLLPKGTFSISKGINITGVKLTNGTITVIELDAPYN